MTLVEELVRAKPVGEMLSLGGYFHLFKLLGNLIDGDEGVIEQRVGQLYARRSGASRVRRTRGGH